MLSVIAGAASGDAALRQRCLDAVAGLDYRPVYKHLRLRWRLDAELASDLTQGFFARALEKGYLGDYDPTRGRFRTFLRVCVDRFVANERASSRRDKRGGGALHASIDLDVAESEIAAAACVGSGGRVRRRMATIPLHARPRGAPPLVRGRRGGVSSSAPSSVTICATRTSP